jgi:hypothetical protein
MSAARKRGPRKGDGGRPKLRLDTDPDRKIIVAALWYWRTHGAQRSFEVLQLLDNLLTQHDVIELEVGTQMVDGAEYGRLTVINTASDRKADGRTHSDPGRNVAPDRRPLSGPDRGAFRKSRLQLLRAKIDRYRNKRLDKLETAYCSHCDLAFMALAADDPVGAAFIFATVGWEMSEAERKRLAAILAAKHVAD